MLNQSGVVTTLQTDENDNIILDFPTELLEVLGWEEGDDISIQAMPGRIVLSKCPD